MQIISLTSKLVEEKKTYKSPQSYFVTQNQNEAGVLNDSYHDCSNTVCSQIGSFTWLPSGNMTLIQIFQYSIYLIKEQPLTIMSELVKSLTVCRLIQKSSNLTSNFINFHLVQAFNTTPTYLYIEDHVK